ncbi:MAG TPA: hypothetical protein VFA85_06960 [Terriglobales bacterium]|nr:hypothetical protein [Terriglobales bacterium]
MSSLPINLKIDRAERLLRMIEQDQRLLDLRVAQLSKECQESAKSHAQHLAMLTRAELRRLMQEKDVIDSSEPGPHGAD